MKKTSAAKPRKIAETTQAYRLNYEQAKPNRFISPKKTKGEYCLILTVSSKGWVTIPAEMRKKYNLTAGSKISIVDYGGVLALVPVPEDPIQHGYGLLKGGDSLLDALKKDREFEKKREERFLND